MRIYVAGLSDVHDLTLLGGRQANIEPGSTAGMRNDPEGASRTTCAEAAGRQLESQCHVKQSGETEIRVTIQSLIYISLEELTVVRRSQTAN